MTLYRWVQRFTPLLIDATRPCRHAVGSRWFVDETYVKVGGRWRYVYPAVDQHGQVIDVYVSERRDVNAARRFFTRAPAAHDEPDEVVTDLAHPFALVLEELLADSFHNTGQYANNRVECGRGTGHRQQLNLLGYALVTNAVTLQRYGEQPAEDELAA